MIGTGCPSIVGPGERGEDSREMVRVSVALAVLCLDVEFFRLTIDEWTASMGRVDESGPSTERVARPLLIRNSTRVPGSSKDHFDVTVGMRS
jgi:hypothetical protein